MTKAVLLIGFSAAAAAAAVSVSVGTFHAPNVRAVCPEVFPLVRSLGGISVSRGMLTRGV